MEKKRQRWLITLLLLATALLFTPGATSRLSDYQAEIWNLGHIGYFFLLISALFPLIKQHFSSLLSRIAVSVSVTLLLSGIIEMLQLVVGRTASFEDVINNVVGTLLALYRCQFRQMSVKGRLALLWLLILMLCWRLIPLFSIAADTAIAHIRHPIVANFETPFELSQWRSDFPMAVIFDESNQLQADLKPVGLYPRVTLTPRVTDWRGYAYLQFDIYNSSQQVWQLHIRINDALHDERGMHYSDRYKTILPINPGWNRIKIDLNKVKQAPASRQMVMKQISKVRFFFMNEPSLSTIKLDNIVLIGDLP